MRARTRDQASLITSLQDIARTRSAEMATPAAVAVADDAGPEQSKSNVVPLAKALTDGGGDKGGDTDREPAAPENPASLTAESLVAEVATLKAANSAQALEIEKLKATLQTFERDADDEVEAKPSLSGSLRGSKVALRARLSSTEKEITQQRGTIQQLRAELAAANDRLARQATQYRDELRRLGSGTVPTSALARGGRPDADASPSAEETQQPSETSQRSSRRRPSLARRIVEEFPETVSELSDAARDGERSGGPAANGKHAPAGRDTVGTAAAAVPPESDGVAAAPNANGRSSGSEPRDANWRDAKSHEPRAPIRLTMSRQPSHAAPV